jgi:hypothetical protein
MPRIIGEGGKGGGVKNQLVSSHKFQDYEVKLIFATIHSFLFMKAPAMTFCCSRVTRLAKKDNLRHTVSLVVIFKTKMP